MTPPPPTPADRADVPLGVHRLVHAHRVRGHRGARLDPLGLDAPEVPELEPDFHGVDEADLDLEVPGDLVHIDGTLTVRTLLEHLRETYCRAIGVQYMHIDDPATRRWLEERMESTRNRLQLGRETQLRILGRLTDAVAFEEFVRRKYVAAKSFSLEGCETLIPLLDLALEHAGSQGVRKVVMAMAHRGRLNVLANVIGKPPRRIFREFEDDSPELSFGSGDVKYHLGHAGTWTCASGCEIEVGLCFNPSHLEYVNPVALGLLRAWQDRHGDLEGEQGLAVLIHGDASFAGEGVVQETLNLSELPAYATGGALHIVVNNQLGYTTPPAEGRSSPYATDVARMLQVPVFHVNGEEPEAVAAVVALALDFRHRFHRDVVIDMYGYRRWGHNEGDEPAYTQPLMYAAIEQRASVRDAYLQHLLALDGVTREEADALEERARERLSDELRRARQPGRRVEDASAFRREERRGGSARHADHPDTAVPASRLAELLRAQARLPDDFHPHLKIARAVERRLAMAAGEIPLDWSAAESLAFATLATEGVGVRLTGQDSARGTFSQRHAELHDVEDGHVYVPLMHLDAGQAPVTIRNSPLSEAAVLGFEYGYSLDTECGLTAWEAQYGDFVNAAQVILDQFLASAEDKWKLLSDLVLLLPHGFDGHGPEHSSARLERFLMLAAEDNIQVAQPTTPAQSFHLLRRQALRRWCKPLVVLTPKSLLRDKRAASLLEDLSGGAFRSVLDDPLLDPEPRAPSGVKRVLLCSGKVYYDLDARRVELGRRDVAVVRLEQLYPLPERELRSALARHPDGTGVTWVQEEPANMGAWPFLRVQLGHSVFDRMPLDVVSRPASASPASGSRAAHKLEQQDLIDRAFAGD